MTLDEVVQAIRQRYERVEVRTRGGGGTTLIVEGVPLPVVLPAWFPEDGVPWRYRAYLLAVLDRLEPAALDLAGDDED